MASETSRSRLTTAKSASSRSDGWLRNGFGLSFSGTQLLQGQIQDQPGPRKIVPTAVSTTSSIKNHVMIQNDSGLEESQRCAGLGDCGEKLAESSMAPPTISVGTRATITS